MTTWRALLLFMGLMVVLLVCEIATETYTVRLPRFMTDRFYADSTEWKHYEGGCKSDFLTLTPDFDKNLPANTQVSFRWRPDGMYFLHVQWPDSKEECVYISLF